MNCPGCERQMRLDRSESAWFCTTSCRPDGRYWFVRRDGSEYVSPIGDEVVVPSQAGFVVMRP